MRIKVEAEDAQNLIKFLDECQDETKLWATVELSDGNSIKFETSKEEVEISERKIL